MAQGNNFLTIPEQEGLFTKSERSGENRSNCPGEDDDDEETEDDVRIIPRSSPIPRKRGHSINDETAEYMRIRLVLPPRRVSFADTTGADLVDVREFVPFDSDDEDDARWEEEENKYREAYRKPFYRLWPEFQPLHGTDLVLAVRSNKVEVESLAPVPDEPLSFEGLIRVLNISYHKSVYVRSTMDGWITYFDYTAEYVQGSNDGETDQFSFRLSFAEPYLFNGARIDFVVRYETSDGEFWANNSGRNYSVTLLQLYEDLVQASKVEHLEIRGILKPSRYREDDNDLSQDTNGGDVDGTERAVIDVHFPVCPSVVEPEIDIEITEPLSSSPPKTSEDTPPAEYTQPNVGALCEQPLQDSSESPTQTDPPEIIGQVTQPLLHDDNLLPSIQEVAMLEVPGNDPSSHSAEANTSLYSNIDDSQSEIPAKVPLDITLPALFPSIQKGREKVEENESEELKEMRGNEEIHTELDGRDAHKQDETLNKMEVDKPKTLTQQCSFQEGNVDNASKNEEHFSCSTCQSTLFEDAQYSRMEQCETDDAEINNDAMSMKNSRKEKTEPKVKNVQVDGEKVAGMESAFTGHGFGVANLELTGGDKVTHHPSKCPEVHLQRRREPGPETKEMAGVLLVDFYAPFVSESRAIKDEFPVPTLEDKGKALSSNKEEPVISIEDKLFHDVPTLFQPPENQGCQLLLSTPKVSSAQPNMVLGQTLIPSIAFFSAVVCLVVGFQEPCLFLVMGLLLASVCL